MPFDKQFFSEATNQRIEFLRGAVPATRAFAVDSRSVKKGEIFVALKGKRCDGHDFLKTVFESGAAGAIISKSKIESLKKLPESLLEGKFIAAVPDTSKALVDLASAWRQKFDCKVVGITGSVGKTLTKEILANVLSLTGDNFFVSVGNQNTSIGLPLNIFRMTDKTKIAVFELGTNRQGDIAKLAKILRPNVALITRVGHAHMAGLGSVDDIATEKRSIFKYLADDNIGVVNGDQPLLASVAYSHPVVKFGMKTTNQVQARKVVVDETGISFVMKVYNEKHKITLKSHHQGMVSNVLAATAVASMLGIPTKTIVDGIQIPVSVRSRFERKNLKNKKGVLIDDCYNANPESMKAALVAFQQVAGHSSKRIAVIGDMLELGDNSAFWHRQLGRFLRKVSSLDHLILVGDMVKWTHMTLPVGLSVDVTPDWKTAKEILDGKLADKSTVLVKGSRGVGLGNLVESLT